MNNPSDLFAVIFWVCFAAIFYTYVGYPAVIYTFSRLVPIRRREDLSDADLPALSLLVAAHNEEDIVGRRIENALSVDYPADKLEVVIATDGCSDSTADVARRFAGPRVRVLEYAVNRGKATVLNESVRMLRGEIVLLSDANTFTDPNAVRSLVRHFRDPNVGVVCGRLVLTDPATGKNADSLYWKYETFLKKCESRLGALLGANGGIYAIRKSLFAPIPTNTIVDDFVIPLAARIRTGCHIVYDADAVAREETPATLSAEFRRRSRIGAGGFQSVGLLWQLLNPARGWVAFTFASHKLLRWVGPFFLIGMFLSNLVLCWQPIYLGTLAVQIGFYLTSYAIKLVPPTVRWAKPFRLATMFTGMNAALLVGFWRWAKGIQSGTWHRTDRGMAPQPT